MSVRSEEISHPGPGEVQVQTVLSAISPGTELLVYRGLVPTNMAVDATLPALDGKFVYPLRYGYSAVGRVTQVGEAVDETWIGRLVFAFNPHETHFNSTTEALIRIPNGLEPEAAAFLPNMETAIGFVMDGRPGIGENVAVFGQGIVGLLTAHLLADYPLSSLITLDPEPTRRALSINIGVTESLDPGAEDVLDKMRLTMPRGADLTYEVSGSPEALDSALRATGFSGRVVVGSWYGTKRASLDLGGYFHRSRIQLISSQVSTIDPVQSGRWDRDRRYDLAWQKIAEIKPSKYVTHRIPFDQADQAYKLLASPPERALQVVLNYDD